jgi:hypothetical protein
MAVDVGLAEKVQWYVTLHRPFCMRCFRDLKYPMRRGLVSVYIRDLDQTLTLPGDMVGLCRICLAYDDVELAVCCECKTRFAQAPGEEHHACPHCGVEFD